MTDDEEASLSEREGGFDPEEVGFGHLF